MPLTSAEKMRYEAEKSASDSRDESGVVGYHCDGRFGWIRVSGRPHSASPIYLAKLTQNSTGRAS